jgi:isopentenyl diphosphate isomerase/L-lactate dehydrogenase-like FMN-dependent dehydrogenase
MTPVIAGALSAGHVEMKITDSPLVAIAQGMKDAGSLMMIGVSSKEQLKAVVATGVPTVKIVKPYRKHHLIIDKIEHAEQIGVKAVGIDIDYIIGGKNRDTLFPSAPNMAPLTTQDLRDIVSVTKLPFILKGILGTKDAEKALDIGAKCLIISNHGGYVLDYAVHALEVLPEIKTIVGDRAKLLVDGGFRRGTDVLKAIALGADGICVGRLLILGLAANYRVGVRDIMLAVTAQLQRAMTLTGCASLTEVPSSILETSKYIPHLQIEE